MSDRIDPRYEREAVELPPHGGPADAVHEFEPEQCHAIHAALAARRPLLVRGETGTGKSQLALAAAVAMKRAFVSKVVDARTEARDLMWRFDAVSRLAKAQLLGAMGAAGVARFGELDESQFLEAGPLWWAFDPGSAAQCKIGGDPRWLPSDWQESDGTVVLIDEIDKADSDVPNGLLEALGTGRFPVPGKQRDVWQRGCAPWLVIVTTNEERSLPDAFLRRCLVLQLALPKGRDALIERLVARARHHFPNLAPAWCVKAAEMTVEDRDRCEKLGLAKPGQAEFLDLLRALKELIGDVAGDHREARAKMLLEQIRPFTLDKHPKDASR